MKGRDSQEIFSWSWKLPGQMEVYLFSDLHISWYQPTCARAATLPGWQAGVQQGQAKTPDIPATFLQSRRRSMSQDFQGLNESRAPLPHQQGSEVPGSKPPGARGFSLWTLHVLPVPACVFPASSNSPETYIQGTGELATRDLPYCRCKWEWGAGHVSRGFPNSYHKAPIGTPSPGEKQLEDGWKDGWMNKNQTGTVFSLLWRRVDISNQRRPSATKRLYVSFWGLFCVF